MSLMKFDSSWIKKKIDTLLDKYPIVTTIVNDIDKLNGQAFLVGGAVRDVLLNLPIKDLDIEVHGIEQKKLEEVLRCHGPVRLTGKIFGVYRIDGTDIDWSLPRSDKGGRKPEVKIDPHMHIKNALARRDLTMNALAINLKTKELLDPFNGIKDIQNKILRSPDTTFFTEDPLRFYRVMQFISRFKMEPDKELNNLCKKMDLSTVSTERVEQEMRKLMLQSKKPSLGLRWLQKIGRLKDVFPELEKLVNLPQPKKWHPEKDTFEHTMQAVDAAARLKYKNKQEKFIILLAALCHDLGKATTTKKIDGKLRSIGHADEGVKPTKKLLKRITHNKDIINTVTKLVKYHMHPLQLMKNNAKASAYKRLAHKLSPELTIQQLAQLTLADRQGRNKNNYEPLSAPDKDVEQFLKNAQKAAVLNKKEKALLQGKDLLGIIEPGPKMGELVKKAYELQMEEGIKNKEELKKRVLSN